VEALEQPECALSSRVPCEVTPSTHAEDYLKTKKEKMGHLFYIKLAQYKPFPPLALRETPLHVLIRLTPSSECQP